MADKKQDKATFLESNSSFKTMFEEVHKDIDKQKNLISTMEHFIDKYLPIQIQHIIGQSIRAVANHDQLMCLKNFELEKFKLLNNELLSEE